MGKRICTSCGKEVDLDGEGKFVGHTDATGHMCDKAFEKPEQKTEPSSQ